MILAQSETLYIEVRTDNYPVEISWTLTNEKGVILATNDSTMVKNRAEYWEYELEVGECIRFDIHDSAGNGIADLGCYRIRRENLWIQGKVLTFNENIFQYSGLCAVDTTCDNPTLVTSNVMNTNDTGDYWFNRNVGDADFIIGNPGNNNEVL